MMKWLPLLLLLLVIGTGVYLRDLQPDQWNGLLESLKVPREKPDAPVSVAPASTPVAPRPTGPEYITPTTTDFSHSAHVADVAQPTQPSPPQPPATSTTPTNKVFVPPNPLPAQPAWTWATTDGKVYRNVIVDKVEADRVSIYYDQGSAVIPIYVLQPDIQRLLNFDPDLAAQAIAEREKANKAAAPAQP